MAFGERFVDRSNDGAYALLVDESPIARAELGLVAGVAVGVLAALILLHPRFRGSARTILGRLWPLALVVLALLHCVASAWWSPLNPLGSARHALLVATLRHAGLLVALGGLIAMALAALAAAIPRRSLQALALAAFLGLAPSVPLHGYAESLRDVRVYALGLPHGPERVHVGSAATLRPAHYRVSGPVWIFSGSTSWLDEAETGWHPVERVVAADKAGPFEVTIEATRPRLRQVVRVTLQAGEDRGNAALPLAVGNRWRYRLTSQAVRGNLLGDTTSTQDRGTLSVTVIGDEWREGVHVWKLSLAEQDGPSAPPRMTEPIRVYPFDGALYEWDGTHAAKKDPLFVEAAPIATEGPCVVAFLPRYGCSCAPARGAFAIAGPVRCHRDDRVNPVQGAIEGIAFIMTLGLASITGKETWDAELIEAQAGR